MAKGISDEEVGEFVELKRTLIRGVRKTVGEFMRSHPDASSRFVVTALSDAAAIAATSAHDLTREEFQEFSGRSYDYAVELRRRRTAG